ncbi:MAG: phosphorylase kinase, partial [Alphaproteobacteria bacterium]|nr:phosphorylase kinase [Alphaproteobacteria bacterium]
YPELYVVPKGAIAAERRNPGSQERQPNDNVPLLWTQSLTWLGDLLLQGLILPEDLDPSGRRLGASLGAEQVLVSFVPARDSIATALEAAGLAVTRPGQLTIASSRDLAQRMAAVGANPRLGLSGHPPLRMETMVTARLYRQGGQPLTFLPAVLEESTFYLSDDPEQLVDAVESEISQLARHWRGSGAPVLLIPVEEGPFQRSPDTFLRLGERLRSGLLDGVAVQLAPLPELLDQAQWAELPPQAQPSGGATAMAQPPSLLRASTGTEPLTPAQEQELEESPLDDLTARLWRSTSLPEQAELLEQLVQRLGLEAPLEGPAGQASTPQVLLEEIYRRA